MVEFEVVALLGDITDGGMKQVQLAAEPTGLYRIGSEVFAIHDICTHEPNTSRRRFLLRGVRLNVLAMAPASMFRPAPMACFRSQYPEAA
jgi:hypothetical protein